MVTMGRALTADPSVATTESIATKLLEIAIAKVEAYPFVLMTVRVWLDLNFILIVGV